MPKLQNSEGVEARKTDGSIDGSCLMKGEVGFKRRESRMRLKFFIHVEESGLNFSISTKHYFHALFMFHLHIKSPISLENRFQLDLGTTSSML